MENENESYLDLTSNQDNDIFGLSSLDFDFDFSVDLSDIGL